MKKSNYIRQIPIVNPLLDGSSTFLVWVSGISILIKIRVHSCVLVTTKSGMVILGGDWYLTIDTNRGNVAMLKMLYL